MISPAMQMVGSSGLCGSGGVRAVAQGMAALAMVLLTVASVRAADRATSGSDPQADASAGVYRLYGGFEGLPGGQKQETRDLWIKAMRLEAESDLLASAAVYEEVVRQEPDDSFGYWRVSRNYYRYGDELPAASREEKIRYLTLGAEWSARGLEIDPECGECCLYRFSSMATLATTRGVWTAMRNAKEMSKLLDRGIALRPTHADNEWNTTLGNLYYAASHFYRITPEWFWLKWLIGYRGDRERALEYARQAHQISPMRVDYHVTLGAALLCAGTENGDSALVTEGVDVLSRVDALQTLRGCDPVFREHARGLVANPESACTYSPDGQIDVKGELARGQRAQEEEEQRSAKRRKGTGRGTATTVR